MLENCVTCGYSLKGLPEIHRCPECGRGYDRDSAVFRQPRTLWNIVATVGFTLVATKLVIEMYRTVAISVGQLVLLGMLVLIAVLIPFARRPHIIVVSHRTFEVIGSPGDSKTYLMDGVTRARWNLLNGAIELIDDTGELTVSVPDDFLGSHRTNKRVVQAVNAYLDARSKPTVPPSGPPISPLPSA